MQAIQAISIGAWAVLLFGGWIFGKGETGRSGNMPRWTRLVSSAALVGFAWLTALQTRDQAQAVFSFALAVGMTLGFIGDLFMAQVFPLKQYVLGGIGSFGLCHVAYIIGALNEGGRLNIPFDGGRVTALIVTWIVAVVCWYFVVYRPADSPGTLHKAALPYALLLASTCGVAIGLALHDPRFVIMAVGAVLFLISDLILAARLFNGLAFSGVDDAVWLTYGPGQMLIVITAVI